MGLDQRWDAWTVDAEQLALVKQGVHDDAEIEALEDNYRLTYHWQRKENWFHDWALRKARDLGLHQGSDFNLVTIWFPPEALAELVEELREALAKHERGEDTSGLLEGASGFFFGGTDKDDYYWQSLARFNEVMGRVVGHPDCKAVTYWSWW